MTSAASAIVKEITINSPAERIFAALVDPAQRVAWWGAPGKFQATHMESDLRPGGAWLMSGTGTGGLTFTLKGVYRTIDSPRLLEFTWLDDGQQNEPPTLVRFDLEEKDRTTTLVRLTHSGFTSETTRGRYQGWPWLLALLQAYVQNPSSN